MKPSEQLRAAKALIEDPARWCPDDFAQQASGRPTWSIDLLAVRWGSIGALAKINYPNRENASMFFLLVELCRNAKHPYTQTHEEVMRSFDRAIAAAEAKES